MNYLYDDKVKLCQKIEKIKNKKLLTDIFLHIYNDKNFIKPTINNNGMYLFFHQLDNETYEALEAIINKMNPIKPVKEVHFDIPVDRPLLKYSCNERYILKQRLMNKILEE